MSSCQEAAHGLRRPLADRDKGAVEKQVVEVEEKTREGGSFTSVARTRFSMCYVLCYCSGFHRGKILNIFTYPMYEVMFSAFDLL